MITVVRFYPDDDWYIVTFAYNPEVVDVIKSVPSFGRTWMPEVKCWHVHSLFASELATTLRRLGHTVIGLDDEPSAGCHCSGSSWARLLFERVGPGRADAVHRALSRVVHPDNPATGDLQIQQELNDARELVRKDAAA